MHDIRFYHRTGEPSLLELASEAGGHLKGDGNERIVSVDASDRAGKGAICFYEGKPTDAASISADATACFISDEAAPHLPAHIAAIIVENPRHAFSLAANAFLERRTYSKAWPDLGAAKVAETAELGPNVILSDGVEIGEYAKIGPNTVIGPGVKIGAHTDIGVSCLIESALIGDNVIIKANTVIGGTGFGVVPHSAGLMQAPHFGRVIIQDHAAIGSNCCVDRGVFGDTMIGEHTRLDNLIQIGHNVVLGRHCVIAAFTGISGSVTVGNAVQMGGRVGLADHLTIGDGARLAAGSGHMHDIPAGETWGGLPAKPMKQWMREIAWLRKNTQPRRKP